MKNLFTCSIGLATAILFTNDFQLRGQSPPVTSNTVKLSAEMKPLAIYVAMQRVADWQLANPSKKPPTDWTQAAGDDGLMALAGISGDAKYRAAMLALAESNHWRLGPQKYHADDQGIGQLYSELYFLYRDPKMLAPMRKKFDWILAHPPAVTNLDSRRPDGKANTDVWTWCDSLFMAPPSWVRLYAATGDERYLNFAVSNFWCTTDFLYDKSEHLFFRDSTYFDKREANGQKVFWSRGNGWVLAGLVRVLQYLPMNHPDRPRFEQLFQEMAEKVLTCQQPDGLWHSSLLDPMSYPLKETSGSGFFTYALAWGVNQGLLGRAQFEPAVRKAWAALVGCVDTDGKLTHAQPIGANPKNFDENSTEVYGVGAFLLAGSEIYRMTMLESGKPMVINVTNPANFRRENETVEINLLDLYRRLPSVQTVHNLQVMDGLSSRCFASQRYASETNSMPNKLLFQLDLAPHETRTFYIFDASVLAAVPPPILKTFARYVPERADDFAWESDRIAHRMYGWALMTTPGEHLTSSGVDVWVKRSHRLVVDEMYRRGDYHNDHGDGMDDYRTGTSCGDGGLGVWNGGKLLPSKNYKSWKLITTGPIRSEFELTYDTWVADGREISETKRISIDAGSNMSRVESIFSSDEPSPLAIGIGLTERPGENVTVPDGSPAIDWWTNSTAKGIFVQNQGESWMTYWQPQDFNKGTIGVAIVLPKGSIETFTNDNPNLPVGALAPPTKTMIEGQPALRDFLAITKVKPGEPFVYYLGAGWNLSGDFPDAKAWNNYVRRFTTQREQPLQVKMRN